MGNSPATSAICPGIRLSPVAPSSTVSRKPPGLSAAINLLDGSRILERLGELDHEGRSFSYSFVGTPPIPVSASHTSVTVTALPAGPDARTRIACTANSKSPMKPRGQQSNTSMPDHLILHP
jgi:hypothetical protein